MSGTGLVAGKFDPPHRGHALLVDSARIKCARVIVLVFDYAEQTVPVEQRVAWLREIHPGVDVRAIPMPHYSRIDALTAEREAANILNFLGEPVDLLFTSEDYGDLFAAALGTQHYIVDRERAFVPITGTMVRRSPAGVLAFLEPCVRAYFVPRVCVAGAESTGKSTLCKRLAAHYDTAWVPEYGREYATEKERAGRLGRWAENEFAHIAFEQQRREDDFARLANRVLLCDTDALAPRVWCERYLGREPVDWPLPPSRIALYLVPYPDVAFVADAIRDGEHKRFWMHERLLEVLGETGRPLLVLRGTFEERDAQAVEAIDALLA
jgi:HTH-type transcriptional regulator, transcriptional repressor of NAD biosynthesis genes